MSAIRRMDADFSRTIGPVLRSKLPPLVFYFPTMLVPLRKFQPGFDSKVLENR